jgi:hypothetical protein
MLERSRWRAACEAHREEGAMNLEWNTDVDAALALAGSSAKPILADFTAAPH